MECLKHNFFILVDSNLFFVSGIMTLTRTPCELDKMSLFQDLKLKRRKVDSRCSSDGKSCVHANASSNHSFCHLFFLFICLDRLFYKMRSQTLLKLKKKNTKNLN